MAYEKQTWHTGDVITESKLNHMEDGIANAGALVIHLIASETPPYWGTEKGLADDMNYAGYYVDVTPGMIESAMTVGRAILVVGTYEQDGGIETYWATSFEAMNKTSIPPEAGSSLEYRYDLYLHDTDSMPDIFPWPGSKTSFDADDCFVVVSIEA